MAARSAASPLARVADVAAAVGYNAISDKLGSGEHAQMPTRPMVGDVRVGDPRYNIGSKYYDPSVDPALNPRNNFS